MLTKVLSTPAAMPLRNPILAPFFHSPAPPTGRPHQARRHKSVPTPVPTPNLASFRKTRPAIRRATGAGNEKVHNQSHFTFSLPLPPAARNQKVHDQATLYFPYLRNPENLHKPAQRIGFVPQKPPPNPCPNPLKHPAAGGRSGDCSARRQRQTRG